MNRCALGLALCFLVLYPLSSCLGFDLPEIDSNGVAGDAPVLLGWDNRDLPLRWAVVDGSTPDDSISFDDFFSVVSRSFDTWENIETSYVDFERADGDGAVDGVVVMNSTEDPTIYGPFRVVGSSEYYGYERRGPPYDDGFLNCVVCVRDHWADFQDHFAITNGTLAVTIFAFDTFTRNIEGADVFFNCDTVGSPWAIVDPDDPPSPPAYDVENTMTHELGHFIGLAHVDPNLRPFATMVATAAANETDKRSLNQDDINGASYLYPEPGFILVQPDRNTIGLKVSSDRPAMTASHGGGGGCSLPPGKHADCRAATGMLLPWLPLLLALCTLKLRAGRRTAPVKKAAIFPLLFFLPFSCAFATVVERLNLAELTLRSSNVLIGIVDATRPVWVDGSGMILTRVDLVVSDPLKGSRTSRIGFFVPGGVIGGKGVAVSGAPGFSPGDEVLVFLAGRRRLHVVGLAQGKFAIERHDGRAEAVQDTTGLCLLDVAPPRAGETGGAAVRWRSTRLRPGGRFSVDLEELIRSIKSFIPER